MSSSPEGDETHFAAIIADMSKCGLPSCGGSLRGPNITNAVKVGFKLFHASCARKYQNKPEASERAPQGPSRGNVTVLPECRNTEGWYDWTHGQPSPWSMQRTLYERCLASRNDQFVWV